MERILGIEEPRIIFLILKVYIYIVNSLAAIHM